MQQAYFGIKYHKDNRNRELIHSICNAIHKAGINTRCMVRDFEKWGEVDLPSRELMQQTFEIIKSSDMVILEMTEKGVGLGIEAGYAVAVDKPLIVLIQDGALLSNTMSGIANTVIKYNDIEMIRKSLPNKKMHRTQKAGGIFSQI